MKRILLSTCAGIFCFGLSSFYHKVHAQGVGVAQERTQLMSWIAQARQMGQQLTQLYQNYQMIERTWNAVSHARDVSGMMSAIGEPTRRYLPDASDLVSGVGTGARLVQNAGNLRSANQLFSALPQASRSAEVGARWIDEMNRREITTANVQATADQALTDVQNQMAALAAMRARIAISPDEKDISDVRANIDVQRQNLMLHQASLQALQLKLMAADRMEATRREQFEAQGARRWADATQASVDALQGP